MSIRNKLFLSISITVALIMLMLIYVFLPHLENLVLSRTNQAMEGRAKEAAAVMEGYFARRGVILRTIALNIEYQHLEVDNPALPNYLRDMAANHQRDFNYLYAGFANKVHITTRATKPPSGFDPTVRPWYQAAWQYRDLIVTEPYRDIQTGRISVSIAYPIDLFTQGTLGTDLFLGDIAGIIRPALFHTQAEALLVSQAGRILYLTDSRLGSLDDELSTVQQGLLAEQAQKIKESNYSPFRFILGGEEQYAVCSPVSIAGWTVITYLPSVVLDAERQQFAIYAILVAAAGICFIFLIVYVMIYRITGPLEAIAQTAVHLGDGNLKVNFPGTGTREIEKLAGALNHMRDEIRELLQEKEALWEESAAQNEELSALNDELNALYEQTKSLNESLEMAVQDKEYAYLQTIMALTDAIEASDFYTRGHSERVLRYAELVGQELDWDEAQIAQLRYAAILHDVGKIGIPSVILTKPGKLTDEEFRTIQTHPELGWRILKNIDHLRPVGLAVWQHHERMDGKGYPRGLTAEEISPIAKVLSVVDSFDAMTSQRSYRACLTIEEACTELRRCAGTQFDSTLVEIMCEKIAPFLNLPES